MTATATSSDLQSAPGVGPRIAEVLTDLGVNRLEDLRGADPQAMYDQLCIQRGDYVDRCVLYVFRCAVYFAENPRPDPELLKWWNWKDNEAEGGGGRRRAAAGG